MDLRPRLEPRTVAEINAERPVRQDERLKVLKEVRLEVERRCAACVPHWPEGETALRGVLIHLDTCIKATENYQG